jgi:hypothetical protein
VLGLQLVQVVSLEAPVAVEYLPAPQTAQLPCVVAPAVVRYLPAAQSVHEKEPIKSLYFPAMHAVHVPPFGPEYPRLHRQL